MLFLKDASIKKRLTSIIMAASSISVLLTTIAISVIGVYNLRLSLIAELEVSASIVGDRNTAALLFNDDVLAENNMRVFSVKRSIMSACLYEKTGAVFASYVRENIETPQPCPTDLTPRSELLNNTVEVMQPIEKLNEHIGSIYIESDLRDVDKYIQKQGYIAFAVIIAALAVSYVVALQLQRAISRPVLKLAQTARDVSANKDYSVKAAPFGDRADKQHSENEIAQLADSFNHMLHEIGERENKLKLKNIELEKARDQAEAANRAKSQFLANISHELRTPLNAIIGFSSILMNQLFGALGDAKYMEYARDINESGSHLLDIINDILDLAKAEAGKLDLAFEEIHIAKAVAKCTTILSERAEKGKITVTTDIPRGLPPLIADRLRLIQILLNVLSNAIKFTEEGGKVHLAVTTRNAGGEAADFIITVADTGIGMQKEDIIKAFQSFGQVDSGLNRKYEGTGLGLPLTKKLVEIHGGTIHIDSELGHGTTVTLTLPAVPADAMEAAKGV